MPANGDAAVTAQIADTIAIDGNDHALFSEPLEAYYRDLPRPAFIPESTANWRGYVARWEIRAGRLFLIGIRAEICDVPMFGWDCTGLRRKVGLGDLFAPEDGVVFAGWFSGTLRVPVGAQIQYQHMGYESVFEFDLMLMIENGIVRSTTTIDNRWRLPR